MNILVEILCTIHMCSLNRCTVVWGGWRYTLLEQSNRKSNYWMEEDRMLCDVHECEEFNSEQTKKWQTNWKKNRGSLHNCSFRAFALLLLCVVYVVADAVSRTICTRFTSNDYAARENLIKFAIRFSLSHCILYHTIENVIDFALSFLNSHIDRHETTILFTRTAAFLSAIRRWFLLFSFSIFDFLCRCVSLCVIFYCKHDMSNRWCYTQIVCMFALSWRLTNCIQS